MVDVFISYSRADQEKVGMLARMIASEGYQVWWDADLPPHMSYGDVITAKIGAAKAAVVVWSETAAASEWVRAEADVARNQKKLIQTAIDEIIPPLPFNQIQCAMIGDWNGEADHHGWNKVKQSLVALCGPRGEAAEGGVGSMPADEVEQAARTVPPPSPAPAPTPTPAPQAAVSRAARPAAKKKEPQWSEPASMGKVFALIGGCFVALFALLVVLLAVADDPGTEFDEFNVDDGTMYDNSASGTGTDTDQFIAPGDPAPTMAPSITPLVDQTIPPLVYATVQDPDGYTNVRAGPSAQSAIIRQIAVGQMFVTFQQDNNWWAVRLIDDGTEGYIYFDRIVIIGPRE